MNREQIKQKIEHIVLTALGVGLAAMLQYVADLIKTHTG